MKRTLKAYQVKLTTLGPVFVGSGKEYTKKEYVFLPKNQIGILDTVKLYQFMKKRGLQLPFEDYVVNDNRQDLIQWLKYYKLDLSAIKPCIKYTMDMGDTVLQRGTKATVMEHMKDSFGMPYVPGSTIKGMLRTILMSYDITEDAERYDTHKRKLLEELSRPVNKGNRNTYLQKNSKQMEADAFCLLQREKTKPTDAVNDILSGMIVSDSKPLNPDRLILCQRIEQHVDGSAKTLNLLRECIRPGSEIEFMLTIDEDLCKYSIETITMAIESFNVYYNECFLRAYQGVKPLQKDNVYIGGGVGFVSKTVVYPLLDREDGIKAVQKIFENTKVPANHKHYKDAEIGVSPHILKCTKYEGQLLQMGLCKIASIESIS